MFIEALFKNAKTQKQPKCPSTEEMIKKMWYICTMEYYSAVKKDEIMPFAATWMDLESVILSEVSQTEKEPYLVIALICGIWKEMIQMNLQNRKRLTDLENQLMVAMGKGQLGTLGRTCTHCYI